jgi:hypothetical protein
MLDKPVRLVVAAALVAPSVEVPESDLASVKFTNIELTTSANIIAIEDKTIFLFFNTVFPSSI